MNVPRNAGRPRKRKQLKNEWLRLRIAASDLKLIYAASDITGTTASAWILDRLLPAAKRVIRDNKRAHRKVTAEQGEK